MSVADRHKHFMMDAIRESLKDLSDKIVIEDSVDSATPVVSYKSFQGGNGYTEGRLPHHKAAGQAPPSEPDSLLSPRSTSLNDHFENRLRTHTTDSSKRHHHYASQQQIIEAANAFSSAAVKAGKAAGLTSAGSSTSSKAENAMLGETAIMRVRVSRESSKPKVKPELLYPYTKLPQRCFAYRGYPLDGTDSMKRSRQWRVQLVPSVVAHPNQPLPGFPDRSALAVTGPNAEYRPVRVEGLTAQERLYNSGEYWQDKPPVSSYYYTASMATRPSKAGYTPSRKYKDGNQTSIYNAAVTGAVDMYEAYSDEE
eukprot:Lankesteria_metandrocarpae@DN2914_c0_g1_i1.p1